MAEKSIRQQYQEYLKKTPEAPMSGTEAGLAGIRGAFTGEKDMGQRIASGAQGLAKLLSSADAMKIAAGQEKDPFMAEALVQGAEGVSQREDAAQAAYAQAQKERRAAQADWLKQQDALATQAATRAAKGDKKAQEDLDALLRGKENISTIDNALELNKNTLSGLKYKAVEKASRNMKDPSKLWGISKDDVEAFKNTRKVTTAMKSNVLDMLSNFKGAISDKEREFLEQMVGASETMSPTEREIAMQETKRIAQNAMRRQIHQRKMRGGEATLADYKPVKSTGEEQMMANKETNPLGLNLKGNG